MQFLTLLIIRIIIFLLFDILYILILKINDK